MVTASALSSQTINHPDFTQQSSSSSTFFSPFSSYTPIFIPQPQPQFIPLALRNANVSVPPPPPPLPPYQQQLRPPSFLPVLTTPNAYLPPPSGVSAYPSAYSAAIRPVFPPRPRGGLGPVESEYEQHLKDWGYWEREREKQRQYEKEKEKNNEDAGGDNRSSEHGRSDVRFPKRNNRYNRRNKKLDWQRNRQREKEKKPERYEREAGREKIRKERDQRRPLEDVECEYEQHLKDWEYWEREREKQRQYEKEREKERERKRRNEIIYDEENDDEDARKRWHGNALEERRRIREKEDDLADRKKEEEEEEITEAKKRTEEEEKQQTQRRETLKLFSGNLRDGDDTSPQPEKPTVSHPVVPCHPAPGPPGVRPIFPPLLRPSFVPATPVEKPQTTVYVGKIAPMVENDFLLSLLQLCGPVKNWMRHQDPSNGAPKGFGFCEFESAEGVLRALRLLNRLSIDGQELMLNVNQATRDYLDRYVGKKTEDAKKLTGTEPTAQKEGEDTHVNKSNSDKVHLSSNAEGNLINNEIESEKESNNNANFGVVTDLDKEANKEASQKLMSTIEERLKNRPSALPPASPAPLVVVSGEKIHKERDQRRSLKDVENEYEPHLKDWEYLEIEREKQRQYEKEREKEKERNNEDSGGDNRSSEHYRTDVRFPKRNKGYNRRSKKRDWQREKEKKLERYEREAGREKICKERDQRRPLEDVEHEYEQHLKDWEYWEREREKQRQYEKERERKRRKEIIYDEENDDEDARKRWHGSALEERRRIREKEDDLADRKKEEEEITEAKKRSEEEEKQQTPRRETLKLFSGNLRGSDDTSPQPEKPTVSHLRVVDDPAHKNTDSSKWQVSPPDNSTVSSFAIADIQHNSNIPAKKLGFGLVGSRKRAAVPSVFNAGDDDTHKDKKLRALVSIDYSIEVIQAVQPSVAGEPLSNLAAAAEFTKRISNAGMKEEKAEYGREKGRWFHDRSSQRDKGQNNEDAHRAKDKNHGRDRDREQGFDVSRPLENMELRDAKQLIETIPRTKVDLFSYEINWALYDQHALHERMRKWISKKIVELLGEEETSLVDFIVSSTQEHVKAAEMLEMLESILDEEAEMFVLKMWRMIIFEIKKVETGLHFRSTRS